MREAAEHAASAVASGTTDHFRICANDECRWVFQDTSRGGRRRWCDMTSCGNVAKVRRYRAKQREAAGNATGSAPADDEEVATA